jgi:hypothetical protein
MSPFFLLRLPGVSAASVYRFSVAAASVKGYLRIGAGVRKGFFRERCVFFPDPRFAPKI